MSQKMQVTVQPTLVSHSVSHKIKQHLKPCEVKPSVVNQQSLVHYQFKCNLCDACYVGYTRLYLHQPGDEHKNAASSLRWLKTVSST